MKEIIVKILSGLFATIAIIFALGLAYNFADAKSYESNTDYYDHTLYEPTEAEIEMANQEWKQEHSDLQTPLTPQHESEIRGRLSKGVR